MPPSADQILIEPNSGRGIGVGELWRYRDLAYFLVVRDLKVRYRQTFFGAAWAILQPVLLMVVFSVFLGRVNGIGAPGVPYPLFALAGLVPWILFSQSVGGASNSVVNSQNLISKVYFPRLLLPLSAVVSYIADFLVASMVLLIAILISGREVPVTFLLVPVLGALAVATALAVGLFLAAVNVQYRDVKYAIPFLLQLWLFASPVVYSADLVPDSLRPIFSLNPMAGVIDGFRWASLGGPMPATEIIVSAIVTGSILLVGVAYFRRVERSFADTI